jgi:hypothetical protein
MKTKQKKENIEKRKYKEKRKSQHMLAFLLFIIS